MTIRNQIVLFTLGDQRYAVALSAVERVVRVVEVTPLPQAPDIVLGVVNVQGRVTPVIDLRRRFRLPQRAIALNDQLVIAHTSRRSIAWIADAVTGVVEYSASEAVAPHDVVPGIEYVKGVLKQADGLVLIHDLDEFLSLEEETALHRAIEVA